MDRIIEYIKKKQIRIYIHIHSHTHTHILVITHFKNKQIKLLTFPVFEYLEIGIFQYEELP